MTRFSLLVLGAAGAFGLVGCGGSGSNDRTTYAYVGNRDGASISTYRVAATGELTAIGSGPEAVSSDPCGLAATPNGKYLYAATFTTSINQYKIEEDGTLTPLSPATVTIAGSGDYGIVVSPNSKYVYAVGGDNKVYQYVIESDGTLTPNATPTIDTGGGATLIAVSPNGQFVFVACSSDNTIARYEIGAGGSLTSLGTATSTSNGPFSMSFNEAGTSLYVGNYASNTVQGFTVGGDGSLTSLGAVAGPNTPYGVAEANGFVFSPSYNGTTEIKRYEEGGNGALTELAPALATTHQWQWPIAAYRNVVYVCNQGDNNVGVYSVGAAGDLTLIDTEPAGDEPASFAFARR